MTDPVVVTAVFRPLPGTAEPLVSALSAAIPAVHAEPGCLLYALHRADDGTVVLIEKWSSAELLDAHGSAEPVAQLRAAIAGLIAEPPTVTRLEPVPVGDGSQSAV